MERKSSFDQFFTPSWVAQAIVEHFYPALSASDRILEPACGDGRFLMALPDSVQGAGIELDGRWAEQARVNTGREIVTGDALTVDWPIKPNLIVGNPPFKASFISGLLDRAYETLEYGGEVGLLLPCYIFQTAASVVDFNRKWSLSQNMIPRNVFPKMSKPLMFAQFSKDRQTVISGLFLYHEADAILRLAKEFKCLFIGNDSASGVWGLAVERALVELGGEADLQDIYRVMEGRRPSDNQWWREKIRQICQKSFTRVAKGRYALERAFIYPKGVGQRGLFA